MTGEVTNYGVLDNAKTNVNGFFFRHHSFACCSLGGKDVLQLRLLNGAKRGVCQVCAI